MHKPRGLMELVYTYMLLMFMVNWYVDFCIYNKYIYIYNTIHIPYMDPMLVGKGCLQFAFFFPTMPENKRWICQISAGEFVCQHRQNQDTECHPLDIHRDQDLKTPKPPPGWFHDFKSEMVLIVVKIALLLVSVPKILLEISGILLKSVVWRDFSTGCFRKSVIQPVDTFAPTSHQVFTSSSHIPMFSKM